MKVPNQRIHLPVLDKLKLSLFLKREDQVHPTISGNKYRKLKYNLIRAKEQAHNTLLTFGGAYSNHIHATAHAGKEYGFKTIGVIRGEELTQNWKQNPTLVEAHDAGMEFRFVSRSKYREKNTGHFLQELQEVYNRFYLIPEGGTNDLAVRGCEEILTKGDQTFNFICSSVGSGGTLSGLINASAAHQTVLGFPALKGDFLQKDIRKFVRNKNWALLLEYHFGGYANMNEELINFINDFRKKTQIQLDPVYSAKMMYGILDLAEKGYFPEHSKILAIHTGGLQGIKGMNMKLKTRHLPLITI
ncbi:MAG: 1-aminocyclopropane-1-carboxylate deaminase/D-cysteine desulfhydrase [Flavobacteriaceae bacterium]